MIFSAKLYMGKYKITYNLIKISSKYYYVAIESWLYNIESQKADRKQSMSETFVAISHSTSISSTKEKSS
jgi:hypothetical protein